MVEPPQHEIKQQLQQMDPYRFEELIAELWEVQGYETIVRKGSGDRGVDVEATKTFPSEEKILIQAKRFSEDNKVGSEEVRKYATLYQQVPDADNVTIVTTGGVTAQAQQLAQDLDVKIIDGNKIAKYIADKDIDVSEYIQSYSEENTELSDILKEKSKSEGRIHLPFGIGEYEFIDINYTNGGLLSSWKGVEMTFANPPFDPSVINFSSDKIKTNNKKDVINVKIDKEEDSNTEPEIRVIRKLATNTESNPNSFIESLVEKVKQNKI